MDGSISLTIFRLKSNSKDISFYISMINQLAFILRRRWPHARKGLQPAIMLPDGDFLVALHLCAVWNSDHLGSVRTVETALGWRN